MSMLSTFQKTYPYSGGSETCLQTQYFAWFKMRFAEIRREATGKEEPKPLLVVVPVEKTTEAARLAALRRKMGLPPLPGNDASKNRLPIASDNAEAQADDAIAKDLEMEEHDRGDIGGNGAPLSDTESIRVECQKELSEDEEVIVVAQKSPAIFEKEQGNNNDGAAGEEGELEDDYFSVLENEELPPSPRMRRSSNRNRP